MAVIRFIREAQEDEPESVESLEVNVWGLGGNAEQSFVIGSGANFNARKQFWIEVRYSVQGVPVFETRNVVAHAWEDFCEGQAERLEAFAQGKSDHFGYGDMLPETGLSLTRKTHTTTFNGEEQTFTRYSLTVDLDFGAVFGHSAPGERIMEMQFPGIELEDGLDFMRQLVAELEAACQGKHPDPAKLPQGTSRWQFPREINRRAYDHLSKAYQEKYFEENPLLLDAFDAWLSELPPAAHVLDAGCGHGRPVIAHLLDRGFHAVGSDISPAMLSRARAQFPQVEFWEQDTTELTAEAQFDGICSFSSMLYLDTVDFFHSIYRLFRALKPGGSLFLYGWEMHPDWRGQPYHIIMNHWMWEFSRGLDETIHALEEHGYFKVVRSLITETEADREEKIANWRIEAQEEHDEWLAQFGLETQIPRTDYSTVEPPDLPYRYLIIAKRRRRKSPPRTAGK